jgi:hypothetical protein
MACYMLWRPLSDNRDNALAVFSCMEMVVVLSISFTPLDPESGNLPMWAELTILFVALFSIALQIVEPMCRHRKAIRKAVKHMPKKARRFSSTMRRKMTNARMDQANTKSLEDTKAIAEMRRQRAIEMAKMSADRPAEAASV